mmetsp:Transcript_46803/g.61937  ORF Transcript_46803/g.61937 Transcript_46803/m.61937 type:complete len:191 (+) Transcript_46803:92-664(+)|eukprot:CAMPEP_0185579564 /NCGR_PEP_ID=MMETSP0434-20130131/15227_1 /TAXON_ID=626734 ORGANISM="Favella taraikaensis, Strain Fe Narragansett Bay" /NCGR_SAMPLE_ID=MMETSP0434 /ASSEMBLY_ACC=CAM_ASM_000379 /LENGTH=190 /DNA_ID=CAMNT_0028197613 /DNA_START=92 /DNA_END=664 /DNA_ORIENTATION=-
MCTQLVTHERIFTTLAKARELQPHMERLIHKAKRLTREDHLYLKQNLTTLEAIKKVKDEIAPRFRKLPAGFTRVECAGVRLNDKGRAGMIEIMGNELQEVQRNRAEVEKEAYNLETFWQWEAKICEQEVDHYEQLLRDLKSEMDSEILERLAAEELEDVDEDIPKKQLTLQQKQARAIMKEVEEKYVDKK